MDRIIVIATDDQANFQEVLQSHLDLGYAIIHCNSFFRPAYELPSGQKIASSAIEYVAVLELKIP